MMLKYIICFILLLFNYTKGNCQSSLLFENGNRINNNLAALNENEIKANNESIEPVARFLTTDKMIYSAGETITVRYRLLNNTDSTITILGDDCLPELYYNGTRINSECFPNNYIIEMRPGHYREWVWVADPFQVNIPQDTSHHMFVVFYTATVSDTVLFKAQYSGTGTIYVGFSFENDNLLQTLRDSLEVIIELREELNSINRIWERWRINYRSIDSLVLVLANDVRIEYAYIDRSIPRPLILVNNEDNSKPLPKDFKITSVYPNPANPTFWVDIESEAHGKLVLRLFDLSGRLIGYWQKGLLGPGRYSIFLNVNNISSGSYILTAMMGDKIKQAKITILK